jgi:hypothetical protein
VALSSTTKSALQIVRMPLPIASRLLFSEESNHESGVRSLNVVGRAISDTSRDKTAKPTSKGERRSLRSGSLAAALKRRRISAKPQSRLSVESYCRFYAEPQSGSPMTAIRAARASCPSSVSDATRSSNRAFISA